MALRHNRSCFSMMAAARGHAQRERSDLLESEVVIHQGRDQGALAGWQSMFVLLKSFPLKRSGSSDARASA